MLGILVAATIVGQSSGEASISASAPCDPAVRAAAVDKIEDEAFAALKAANEAVAEAARRGAVATAGDAEWAAYKALRGKAERLRLQNLTAAQACMAPPGQAVLAQGGPIVAAAPVSAVLASPRAAPRFENTLAVSVGKFDGPNISRIGTTIRGGFLPGAYATPPTGVGFAQGGSIKASGPAPLTHFSGSSRGFEFSTRFAPDGVGAPGWRWTGGVGQETTTFKSAFSTPTSAIELTGAPRACPADDGAGVCVYLPPSSLITPARQVWYTLNPTWLTGIVSDDLRQRSNKVSAHAGLARAFAWRAPIGDVLLTPGLRVEAQWRSLKEEEQIKGIVAATCCMVFTTPMDGHVRRDASGPGFAVGLTFDAEGAIGDLPLTWSFVSAYGAQTVDLGVNSKTSGELSIGQQVTRVRRSTGVGVVGIGLAYDFDDNTSLAFRLLRRRDTQVFGAFNDRAVLIRPVESTLLTSSLKFRF
ncbi:hypothetical protein ASD79_03450 [Caulobacter sp. Root655]|uniref:hypothetical protein n=1 Tax=Caulobacter sp. Root655 TaxID=1736578 RepID=UPI0006F451F0|nr:hypothetical protein [Caulobacter sp. Root655]KRA66342.1 hypothetical protein ASD79_03450 [Caulobacter sp. Root655]